MPLFRHNKKGRGGEFYYPSNYAVDNEFIGAVVQANEGPSAEAIPSAARRGRMVQNQIAVQERFIKRLGAERILQNLHAKRLQVSGSVGFDYAEIDRNGDRTFTGNHLLLNPSGLPLGEGGHIPPYNTPLESPQLMIGLFGDARKMRAGRSDYMTHLAVVMADSRTRDGLTGAYRDSYKRRNRLAYVKPDLNVAQFSDAQWAKLNRKAEKRARKLLNDKLSENRRIRIAERRVREIAIASISLVAGGVAEVAIEKLLPHVEQWIHYLTTSR